MILEFAKKEKCYFSGDSIHIACIQLVKDAVICLCHFVIGCAKTQSERYAHVE